MPLSPSQIIEKHTHFGDSGTGASLSNPSYYSGMTQTDHMSTVSTSSAGFGVASNLPPLPEQRMYQHQMAPLGGDVGTAPTPSPGPDTQPTGGRAIESGVSGISERERAHLRQISETTVSSVNSGNGHQAGESIAGQVLQSPTVIVPSGSIATSSAGGATGSPLRRSIFRESHEDMTEGSGPKR
jgi:hypothetical protein